MDERLPDIRPKLAIVRRALDDCRRRLAALRGRLVDSTNSASPGSNAGPAVPLFQTPLPLDDRELHFEALDTEDPKREER
jgi:hypothetical protein